MNRSSFARKVRQILAASLAVVLIFSAPGPMCYQALAGTVAGPGRIPLETGNPGLAGSGAAANIDPRINAPISLDQLKTGLSAAPQAAEAAASLPSQTGASAAPSQPATVSPSIQGASPAGEERTLPADTQNTQPQTSRDFPYKRTGDSNASLQAREQGNPDPMGTAQKIAALGTQSGPRFDGGLSQPRSEGGNVPAVSGPAHQTSGLGTARSGNNVPPLFETRQLPQPGGLWRPKSRAEGIGPIKYVWWNSWYWILEALNRGLARDPNRKVSWDKWPPALGLLYLMAKIRYVRSNTVTDPYDYAAKDTKKYGPNDLANAGKYYATDGTAVSDTDNPQMGAINTRFGSNFPPRTVRPDLENMRPSARDAAKLRWRRINPETGREITVPALILSDFAGRWIQFLFHGFGGNTKRDSVKDNPLILARDPEENWPGNEARVDRTSKDHTRVTDDGRPTRINERPQAWIQEQIYGGNDQELAQLRSFEAGKLKLGADGLLPEDPEKPGVDKTGFNNNYNPQLSLLHWLFVLEHNAIADHYRYFHPDWDDETLFQMARKVNVANMNRIHTDEWTRDLLQHPALQIGMHADWYGLLGKKVKMYLMRLASRHPWAACLIRPLRNNDFIWGMPGSKHEHHDGPFQVPTHFRMVYRLHELILGESEILDPRTGRSLGRVDLINFVQNNTRAQVKNFGYEALAFSFVKASAGALVLHNFPRALTKFKNQQDGELTDLAERDLLREREDSTGTYNEFRASVGEPPVTTFLELTGGDATLAKELEIMYEGDVNAVDAGIGILAEPKFARSALGFGQFYQFVFNAPRRVKSNIILTDGFTYPDFLEGMDWVEHSGSILDILARHLLALRDHVEGVVRGFTPWPDVETFPLRMLQKTYADTGAVAKSDLRTFLLGAVAAAVAVWVGAASPWMAAALLAALAAIPIALAFKRMLAMRFMQVVWKKAYTDKRMFMFGTLYRGDRWIERAAFFGRMGALAVMATGALIACGLWTAHPVLAVWTGITALSAISTYKHSNAFENDANVLKIGLRNRMRNGQTVTSAAFLPGETALQKRYWFLRGDNESPVATLGTTYMGLRESGLPAWKACTTALLSHLDFGPKTQRGMTWEQKRAAGIGPLGFFNIYIPNLIAAQGYSNTRVYAPADNTKGLRPGDVDMEEFERMFRTYAPGRDYMTAYDFARMREGNRVRDARERRGNWFSRLKGQFAAKRRADQLIELFADRVVAEDRVLVPAISRDMLLRFYQGSAQYDLMREYKQGDMDPSPLPPVQSLEELSALSPNWLSQYYAAGTLTDSPVGESQGRAIILPGTSILGRALSGLAGLFWKGKVFDGKGGLVNKILGLRIIKARVFLGTSWKDGKPTLIIDYKKTSWLASFIRDEIREVGPGLYLGVAYARFFGLKIPALYFALDFNRSPR